MVKLLVDIRGNMPFFLLFLLSAEVAARATRERARTRGKNRKDCQAVGTILRKEESGGIHYVVPDLTTMRICFADSYAVSDEIYKRRTGLLLLLFHVLSIDEN